MLYIEKFCVSRTPEPGILVSCRAQIETPLSVRSESRLLGSSILPSVVTFHVPIVVRFAFLLALLLCVPTNGVVQGEVNAVDGGCMVPGKAPVMR